MKRTLINVLAGASFALVLVVASGCKGHVEKNAEGEVTSVGVKTDPQATEAAKEAGQEAADAAREAGQDIKEGATEAGAAVEAGVAKAGEAVKEGAQEAAAATDDAAITSRVKARLLADPEVSGLQIDVDTVNGKVTLTGTAESAYQKKEAGKLARNAEGVVSVDNRIEVQPKKS